MKNQSEINILDRLLDEDDTNPITLIDEKGEPYEFEQVAIIPDKGELYCILRPITKIEGIADDEAIVFNVSEEGTIAVVEDEKTSLEIFDKYYDLLEKEWRKKK